MKPEVRSQKPGIGSRRAQPGRPASGPQSPTPDFADLHLHTNFSDGTYSPEELAGRAGQLHLRAVALTDHDTVEGCARMAAA